MFQQSCCMLRDQLPFGWLFGGSMLACRRDRFIQFESRHLVQKVIIMSNVSFATSLCLFSFSHVLWCHLSMIYQCLSLTNIKIYVMPENGLACSMAILEGIMIRMINQWMGCSFPKMFSQTQGVLAAGVIGRLEASSTAREVGHVGMVIVGGTQTYIYIEGISISGEWFWQL